MFKVQPTNQTLSSGETILLKCEVIGTHNPTISWEKDDELIMSGDHYVIKSEGLQIKSVTTEDSGEYKCIGSNREGVVESTVHVAVQGKSAICGLGSVSKHFPIGKTNALLFPVGTCCCFQWERAAVSSGNVLLFPVGTCCCSQWERAVVSSGNVLLFPVGTCCCFQWERAAVSSGNVLLFPVGTCCCFQWERAVVSSGNVLLFPVGTCCCFQWERAAVPSGNVLLFPVGTRCCSFWNVLSGMHHFFKECSKWN